ncbi:MAG: phage minor head protein [Pseudomonadota bacterium]
MNDFTDKPGYAFEDDPPPEVSDYLRAKTDRPSFDWQDIEPEEHAHAFTVAKAMQLDVLTAIRQEVQKAIDEGRTFEQFQRDLRPRLVKLGWWGRQDMVDPATGEAREVQLGSPRRLRTIYQTNMRAARAAGQWQRMQRTKRALPYLLYLLGPSERHRPHHAAQEGTVRPIDSAFWDEWMPPNGFGCKCHVRQISREEAERRGITPDTAPITREVVNRRTGSRRQVAQGVDAGFANNPGKTRMRNAERFLEDKLAGADPDLARVAIQDIVSSWRFTRLFDEGAPATRAPVGRLDAPTQQLLGSERPVVTLASTVAGKMVRAHGLAPRDLARVQALLDGGVALRYPNGDLAFTDLDGPRPWLAVISIKAGIAEAFVSTLFRAQRQNYLHNVAGKTETVRGADRLEAWQAAHPRR